jgi:hypothetical protein
MGADGRCVRDRPKEQPPPPISTHPNSSHRIPVHRIASHRISSYRCAASDYISGLLLASSGEDDALPHGVVIELPHWLESSTLDVATSLILLCAKRMT